MIIIVASSWLVFGSLPVRADVQEGGATMTITAGKNVSIEYSLSLENKEVIDSNVGGEPLSYVQGSNQIIPGLENALEGMKVGESKKVSVGPEEGYGPVIPEAIVEVGKEQLPLEAFQVDAQVQAQSPDGDVLYGQVTKIEDDTATIDFNHPLAGKTLFFDVKVLDIQ